MSEVIVHAPVAAPVAAPVRETTVARSGRVCLIGAGPGDPELLTLKAVRRLNEADAVVTDRLVGPRILAYARPDAARFDVGKEPGQHRWRQDEINALLVRLAQDGRRVARLKGGDPFVFGRGGEEVLALRAAGIAVEVIPGVSAALAAPAAVGIPLTHRGLASAVTIATGHARADVPTLDHDWAVLARQRGTLVFLMAVENLELIVANLLAHGRDPHEPAALIAAATTPDQREVRASLHQIVARARRAHIAAPAVLVVGPTVDALRRPPTEELIVGALGEST